MVEREPCGNDDVRTGCLKCYPRRLFVVSTTSVERRAHKQILLATTPEEALAIYNEGTAWPSDYDTSTVETLEEHPTVVKEIEIDVLSRAYWFRCYHDPIGSEGA